MPAECIGVISEKYIFKHLSSIRWVIYVEKKKQWSKVGTLRDSTLDISKRRKNSIALDLLSSPRQIICKPYIVRQLLLFHICSSFLTIYYGPLYRKPWPSPGIYCFSY